MTDDAPPLTPEQIVAIGESNHLTLEQYSAILDWWHGLLEDQAYGGKTHYSMPPDRGLSPPGRFRIPKDVINKLGRPQSGGFLVHQMFGIQDTHGDPPVIHPHVFRSI